MGLRGLMIILCALLLAGCNEPPRYSSDALEFLRSRGVDYALAKKLTKRQPLTEDEVTTLQVYDNIAVKHLLGANLGTPSELLTVLAKHPHFEVRTGVASNPNTPLPVLLSLRVKGRYDTVNTVLAGNPMLPQSVLREMYNAGEGSESSFASNPNLPEDLMRKIDKNNDFSNMNRISLASNPKLPRDLLDKYLVDKNEAIRGHARSNPKLPQEILREMYNAGESMAGLAGHSNLPEDLMRAIDKRANDKITDWYLHSILAENPKLPRDLLDKYLVDQREAVRNAAQENPQLNPAYKGPEYERLGGP
jgi:hypothetical protein